MKLYRLSKGCEGEYSCDNYIGLFKTAEGMLSFLEKYIKKGYLSFSANRFENVSICLGEGGRFIFSETGGRDWFLGDIVWEMIDTDTLI